MGFQDKVHAARVRRDSPASGAGHGARGGCHTQSHVGAWRVEGLEAALLPEWWESQGVRSGRRQDALRSQGWTEMRASTGSHVHSTNSGQRKVRYCSQNIAGRAEGSEIPGDTAPGAPRPAWGALCTREQRVWPSQAVGGPGREQEHEGGGGPPRKTGPGAELKCVRWIIGLKESLPPNHLANHNRAYRYWLKVSGSHANLI